MATKNKAAVTTPSASPQEVPTPVGDVVPNTEATKQQATLAWATPGTTSERGYMPDIRQSVVWVDCDHYPQFTDFQVGINVGIAIRAVQGQDAPGDTGVERACRRLSVMAPAFRNWPPLIDPLTMELLPVPTPDDPETYRPLVWTYSPFVDLGNWITGIGWKRALDLITKNSESASAKPKSN